LSPKRQPRKVQRQSARCRITARYAGAAVSAAHRRGSGVLWRFRLDRRDFGDRGQIGGRV